MDDEVPQSGHWPVDPQEEQPIDKTKIWVDGCFDFAHHGSHVHDPGKLNASDTS